MQKFGKKISFYFTLIIITLSVFPLKITYADNSGPLLIGISEGPSNLDPIEIDAYDFPSLNTILQVVEGLYQYNYSSSENEVIPCLAESMGVWDPSRTNLTITLKQGTTFHDDTSFNASDVKWIFDRIQYFTSGLTLPGYGFVQKPGIISSEHLFQYNGTWILNRTEIISEYQVRFALNVPTILWEKMLAFPATAIQKPDPTYSYGTKFFDNIEITDSLIGTGPFELIDYNIGNYLHFQAYDNYHRTWGQKHIEEMYYIIFSNPETMSNAFLNYEIHWGDIIAENQTSFDMDPNLVDIPFKTGNVFYTHMSLYNIPYDVRLAASYAWNYTHFLEEIYNGTQYELHSPIPDGMQFHHEGYSNEPYHNLTVALSILLNTNDGNLAANISSNGLTSSSSVAEWRAVAESSTPIAWYNYTGYQSSFTTPHALQLQDDLKNIGIKLDIVEPVTLIEWVTEYAFNSAGNKRLAFSWGGWGPELNDPIDMIEPLYTTNGTNNFFGLTNITWDEKVEATHTLTDSTHPTREEMMQEIQEDLTSQSWLVPSFYVMQGGDTFSFNRGYIDEQSIDDFKNIFKHWYWFNVQFSPSQNIPATPTLNAISPNPNHNGNISITWTGDIHADSYKVYRYNSPIKMINGSVLELGITTESYWNDEISFEGTYYYAIRSINSSGISLLSNSVNVMVDFIPPDAPFLESIEPNPNSNGIINLQWDDVDMAHNYTIYRYNSLITEINSSVIIAGYSIASNFTDNVGLDEEVYFYALTASNLEGESILSNCEYVSVTNSVSSPILFPIGPNPSSSGNVYLDWNDVPDALGYTIYRYTSNITEINSSVIIAGYSIASNFTDNVGLDEEVYFYALTASYMWGESALSNCESVSVINPNRLPILLPIGPNPSSTGTIHLQWNDVQNAIGYTIYRHTSYITEINSSVFILRSVDVSEYDDTGLSNGDYYYVIEAHTSEGSSEFSNCESVTVSIPPLEEKKIPGFSVLTLICVVISMIAIVTRKSQKY